ncbi:MAG TPA: hypothetical protein VF875_15580 [Anaeromyxobacter sp.]
MTEAQVSRIKEHVFFSEHELDSGLRRFDADPEIVNAWDRLTAGDQVSSDLDLRIGTPNRDSRTTMPIL